jgi:hypothetical protein
MNGKGWIRPVIPTVYSGSLPFNKVLKSTADLDINKISGYIQDNIVLNDSLGITLPGRSSFNYNGLNNELLLSPRLQFSWMPRTKRTLFSKLQPALIISLPANSDDMTER